MKPVPNFTMDELVDEIRAGLPCFDSDGATSQEIADALDVSKDTVTKRLKTLKAAGLIAVVRKYSTSLDGRTITVPAYKLIRKEVKDDEDELEDEPAVSAGSGNVTCGPNGTTYTSNHVLLSDRAPD